MGFQVIDLKPCNVKTYFFLTSDQLPPSNKVAGSFLLTIDDYFMEDGILYHIWTPVSRKKHDSFVQLVVPKSLHLEICEQLMMMS